MNEPEKIVIVNQDSGYLMIDLANVFHQAGYQVNVIAGRLVERDKKLKHGVKFNKIIRYNKKTTFHRLLTWIVATIQIWFLLILKFKNHNILLVSNPPLAPLLTLFIPNRSSVLIYDIFPDALIDAGILKKQSIISTIWKKMNTKAYEKANTVYTITDGMKQVLINYVSESKIKVVPIWIDNEYLKPVAIHDNLFIQKYNLTGKFVVLYAGNLGKTGDVECMIELAKNTHDTDIQYLIVGDGVKREAIEKLIAEQRLTNCMLLPWQSAEMFPHSLSAASLSVVSLGKNTSKIAMPSKLYSYLAVGSPVLSLAAEGSELAKLVNYYEVGRNFEPEKTDDIVKFIVSLKCDTTQYLNFRSNSLTASKNYTQKNALYFLNK